MIDRDQAAGAAAAVADHAGILGPAAGHDAERDTIEVAARQGNAGAGNLQGIEDQPPQQRAQALAGQGFEMLAHQPI